MKRTVAMILVIACTAALFAGCGGKKKDFEPQSFIDEDDYSEAIVYCGTAATAEEIAVFTAADSAAAERLLAAAQKRVDKLIESYKSYGPAAAMSLENSVVTRSGDYVVVVVCSDSESAGKICEKYF